MGLLNPKEESFIIPTERFPVSSKKLGQKPMPGKSGRKCSSSPTRSTSGSGSESSPDMWVTVSDEEDEDVDLKIDSLLKPGTSKEENAIWSPEKVDSPNYGSNDQFSKPGSSKEENAIWSPEKVDSHKYESNKQSLIPGTSKVGKTFWNTVKVSEESSEPESNDEFSCPGTPKEDISVSSPQKDVKISSKKVWQKSPKRSPILPSRKELFKKYTFLPKQHQPYVHKPEPPPEPLLDAPCPCHGTQKSYRLIKTTSDYEAPVHEMSLKDCTCFIDWLPFEPEFFLDIFTEEFLKHLAKKYEVDQKVAKASQANLNKPPCDTASQSKKDPNLKDSKAKTNTTIPDTPSQTKKDPNLKQSKAKAKTIILDTPSQSKKDPNPKESKAKAKTIIPDTPSQSKKDPNLKESKAKAKTVIPDTPSQSKKDPNPKDSKAKTETTIPDYCHTHYDCQAEKDLMEYYEKCAKTTKIVIGIINEFTVPEFKTDLGKCIEKPGTPFASDIPKKIIKHFMNKRIDESDFVSLFSVLTTEILNSRFNFYLLKKIQDLVHDPTVLPADLELHINELVHSADTQDRLRLVLFQALTKLQSFRLHDPQSKECADYIEKTKAIWAEKISCSLKKLATLNQTYIPYVLKRCDLEIEKFKDQALGSEYKDLDQCKPIYSPNEFLEILVDLKKSNVSYPKVLKPPTYWGLVKIPLQVKNLHDLLRQFYEFSGDISRYSLVQGVECEYAKKHIEERAALADKILAEKQVILAVEFCKRGAPFHLRKDLWSLILNLTISDSHRKRFDLLKSSVAKYDLLIDRLLCKEMDGTTKAKKAKESQDYEMDGTTIVKTKGKRDYDKITTAIDDVKYFVFDYAIIEVLQVFSRDTSLRNWENKRGSATSFKVDLGDEKNSRLPYPPNGVVPFHGFSLLVAPLCYVFHDPVTLYYAFKELYVRYFSRLHNVSAHEQGALFLSTLFETTLDEAEPALVYHFHKNGIQPLKIAWRWIIKGFSGDIAVQEVLHLWDFMVSYNTTEILVVFAVGVFAFHRSALMNATNQLAVEKIMSNISDIKVIPILHGMLSSKHIVPECLRYSTVETSNVEVPPNVEELSNGEELSSD